MRKWKCPDRRHTDIVESNTAPMCIQPFADWVCSATMREVVDLRPVQVEWRPYEPCKRKR